MMPTIPPTAQPRRRHVLAALGWMLLLSPGIAAEPLAIPPDIRFLQERAKADPVDFINQNRLAEKCLTQLRATGRMAWLTHAISAAEASLKSLDAEGNANGWLTRARVALAEHRFPLALELAQKFTTALPDKAIGHSTLFDAQFEMGQYEPAAKTLATLAAIEPDSINTHSRRAKFAHLHGKTAEAETALDTALAAARKLKPPQPGVVAWCLAQRGQLAFARGDFASAEKSYVAALEAAPADYTTRTHIAELRAAQGRYDESLALLETLIAETDRPELMQAAGDVALAAKKDDLARTHHDRALAAYRASLERGEILYRHHLAGFFCDVRSDFPEAVRLARLDYAERPTIGTADALAWALSLAGENDEAQKISALSLATGTRDAHILYRAGMILMSAGDIAKGRDLIRRASEENPKHQTLHFHR